MDEPYDPTVTWTVPETIRTLKKGAVVVEIALTGTGDLATGGGCTSVDGKHLIAYMVKQDGLWFWNPFGW